MNQMNQLYQFFSQGMLNYPPLNGYNTSYVPIQPIQNIYITNNNENNQQIQNDNTMFQILQNPNMTNEERLNMLLGKGIILHPIIMKVLNDREKFRETQNNNYSNFNDNSLIGNSQDKNNILKKKPNNNILSNNQISYQQQQNSNNVNSIISIPKFPIDDNILFSDLEKYNLSKDIINRPQGEKINIPYEIFNKVIILWDFIITFNENLINGNLLKYNINENILEFYDKVIDNDDQYFKQLLTLFLLLVARNLKIIDNNSIEQEIFIVKSFLDNPYSTPFNCFYDCLIEILKIISNCSLYKNLFDLEGINIIKIIIEKADFEIDNNQKIILLNSLIALSYETIIIKGKIREELERMSSMSIEKLNLEETLKETEKRKKEINKNDYLEKVKEKIEDLEKQLNEINEKNEEEINSNPDLKKQKNEIENQINSNKSIIKENENLIERKKDLLEKIQNIKDRIMLLKVPRKKLLGSDYLKSDYFYFNTCPGKLFIKNKKEKFWAVIKDKKLFQELTDKFTEKGIREKKLKYYLSRIIHELDNLEVKKKDDDEMKNNDIIDNENKDNNKDDNNNNENNNNYNDNENDNINNNEEKNQNENEKIIENINDITESINDDSIENENIENEKEKEKENEKEKETDNEKENENKNTEDEIIDINNEILENIIPKKYTINEILLGMEEKFSEYLSQFDKEWESEINRNKWKEIIQTTNIENNYIQTLKMFNHRFKNPYKILSEEEEKELKNGEYIISNNIEKYNFIDKNNNIFYIYETDPSKILSPKVKIWSKEIESFEIDKYYTNILLNNIKTHQQLWFTLHFYENIIFGLIKRRENKKKFI